jgi:hypothetical protein
MMMKYWTCWMRPQLIPVYLDWAIDAIFLADIIKNASSVKSDIGNKVAPLPFGERPIFGKELDIENYNFNIQDNYRGRL